MLGLRQELSPRQELTQGLHQKHATKLSLELLMDVRLALLPLPPVPFETTRGIEGAAIAHSLLKKSGLAGILVGGLAEELARPESTVERFNSHKDVDVLVLPGTGKGREIAYADGGIDWWLPRQELVQLRSDAISSPTSIHKTFFVNINSVHLFYKVQPRAGGAALEPGLYYLQTETLRSLLYEQGVAVCSKNSVQIDPNSIETFERKLAERHTGNSREIETALKGVGARAMPGNAIEIFGLEHEDKMALRSDRQLLRPPWIRMKDTVFKFESAAGDYAQDGKLMCAHYSLRDGGGQELQVSLHLKNDFVAAQLADTINGREPGERRTKRLSGPQLRALIADGDLAVRFGSPEEPFIEWPRLPQAMQENILDIVIAARAARR